MTEVTVPASDSAPAAVVSFPSLGLLQALVTTLEGLAYEVPTAVQSAAIPSILKGRDIRASAQTGSGKTAAFVLPLLQRLSLTPPKQRDVRALILAPTRELAVQIGEAINSYSLHLPMRLKTVVAVGGVAANPQMMALRGGADIVIATPGRLLDLLQQSALRLNNLETLVLDEADRMLSLGFAEELKAVFAELPSKRQTLLFSATMPAKVLRLAEGILRDPVCLNIDAGGLPAADLLAHRAIEIDDNSRTKLLVQLLKNEPTWTSVLVFVASRMAADELVAKLSHAGFTVDALHGDLSQSSREASLADFKASRLRVLVATDVAARGLDVPRLSCVVNYDLPRSPTDYVHRTGRTGRAGEAGVAVSFVSAATAAHFRLIEKRCKVNVPREQVKGYEPRILTAPAGDPHGGIKGKRKSKKDKLREAAAKTAKPASK